MPAAVVSGEKTAVCEGNPPAAVADSRLKKSYGELVLARSSRRNFSSQTLSSDDATVLAASAAGLLADTGGFPAASALETAVACEGVHKGFHHVSLGTDLEWP